MEQCKRISDKLQISGEVDSNALGYEGLVDRAIDGNKQLSILVSGVHCAGCIQKIESSLAKEQDIKSVRLNFSTKRLAIIWQGEDEYANDLVKKVESLGYGVKPYTPDIAKEETKLQEHFLLLCLGVAGFAMGNIMLLSVGLWSSSSETMGVATRDLMHWVSAIIAIPTIIFSGRPFFRSAFKALIAGHTNMDVPISIALILASGMSLYETMNQGEHVYFDSAVMLMFFLLIGRYLDMRAKGVARSSASELLSTLSGFANVIEGGNKIKRIAIRDVREGMIIRVSSGDSFPVDGIIKKGRSSVDTSLVTGETLPTDIQAGDEVYAGTINISAPVTIEAIRVADDSLLADIVRLMEKAGQSQARYVRMADKAAKAYTPVVHSMAVIAFLGWWLVGGIAPQDALLIAVTVLIITCPCALGLAVPIVQVIASGKLMKKSVLLKSGDALERLAVIDTILMDKTGTLTVGKPVLQGEYDQEIMQIAVSLAAHSSHPLSKALNNAYKGNYLDIEDVQEVAGKGMKGKYNGKLVKLGSHSWCANNNDPSSSDIELWLSIEGRSSIKFIFKDSLRTDTVETLSKLKKQGLDIIILSGDRKEVVENIAKECDISKFYSEVTPPEKFKIMEELSCKGHKVMMVGDGLNDAPTLAGADVSMAPGTAIDMAQNAADIIFMGEKFAPVYETYNIAKFSQKLVKENFGLAVIYNIVAIPLALAGLVTPLIAAIAMSGSSIIVIGNSFRLRLGK